MSSSPIAIRPFYLNSDKNNMFLLNLKEENNKLKINLESQKLQNEIFEFNSEHDNIPEIFSSYTINDIIVKFSKENNKLNLIEESNSMKIIYKGLVESEKAVFNLNRKEKSIEQKFSELYEIINYQREKIDDIYGFQSIIITYKEKDIIL